MLKQSFSENLRIRKCAIKILMPYGSIAPNLTHIVMWHSIYLHNNLLLLLNKLNIVHLINKPEEFPPGPIVEPHCSIQSACGAWVDPEGEELEPF